MQLSVLGPITKIDQIYKFGLSGGVLAHATMPTDGKLHFDEDERWALGPDDADKIAKFD